MDTYGCGCQHNCRYCYAKSLLSFRNLWNPANPSVADIKAVERTIEKKVEPGSVVRLGGMTDCFQPIEKEHRVTYKTIEALNHKRVHYLIVTKSALIANDEYVTLMDKDLAHIQVSITSTSDDISKKYEPGASLPMERIKAVEKLQKAGFDVSVRLSPYVPQFVDVDIINSIDCDKILVEFLRINTWVEKWLQGIDLSEYTLKSGGYRHLPLDKKKDLLKQITSFKHISVCEDVDEHYAYWKENTNSNKNDCCMLSLRDRWFRGPSPQVVKLTD